MYNESLYNIYSKYYSQRLPRYVTTCPQCLAKGTATSTFTYGFIQKISEQSKQSSFIGIFYHILDNNNDNNNNNNNNNNDDNNNTDSEVICNQGCNVPIDMVIIIIITINTIIIIMTIMTITIRLVL